MATTTATTKKTDAFANHANATITKLESIINDPNFVVNWQKMWSPITTNSFIGNAEYGSKYKGYNIFTCMADMLCNNWIYSQYVTGKQIFKAAKATDNFYNLKTKKAVWIWFPIPVFKKDENGNKTDDIAFMRYSARPMYNVSQFPELITANSFQYVSEVEIPEKGEFTESDEKVVQAALNWQGKPETVWILKNSAPCYYPQLHKVEMPDPTQWGENRDEMLKTFLHEIGHSTMKIDTRKYDYAREELFAESFAIFAATFFGLETSFENTASYIKGWFGKIKDYKNPKDAVKIFGKALDMVMKLYANEK